MPAYPEISILRLTKEWVVCNILFLVIAVPAICTISMGMNNPAASNRIAIGILIITPGEGN